MIAVTAVMPQIHLLHITTHYYTLLHITILEPIVLARVMDHNVQDEKTALKVSFGRTSSEWCKASKETGVPHGSAVPTLALASHSGSKLIYETLAGMDPEVTVVYVLPITFI